MTLVTIRYAHKPFGRLCASAANPSCGYDSENTSRFRYFESGIVVWYSGIRMMGPKALAKYSGIREDAAKVFVWRTIYIGTSRLT